MRPSTRPGQARGYPLFPRICQRLGTPEEFGAACVFLGSVLAGFVSGQNLQVDGGSYRAVF